MPEMEREEGKTYRGEGGRKVFSVGGSLREALPAPPLFPPPTPFGVLWSSYQKKSHTRLRTCYIFCRYYTHCLITFATEIPIK